MAHPYYKLLICRIWQALKMTDLKKLTLYNRHKKNGAKFTPFAGWNMPVSYRSSIDEHLSVRENVGLFDVSHMGEIEVSGPQSLDFLNFALTNDLNKCSVGQAQYSLLCNEHGGTLDDLLVYRLKNDHFFLCVNASNVENDYNTLLERSLGFNCSVHNLTSSFGQLALQGPSSEKILSQIIDQDLSKLTKMSFLEGNWMGQKTILARSGYTGEDGFEIYCSPTELEIWADAMEQFHVPWVGLAARDSLRLEAGFPLHGHELSPEISPVKAGLSWVVGWKKQNFCGLNSLSVERDNGASQRVIHYLVDDRRIPRHGCVIKCPNGNEVGSVLSGGYSPLLKKPMGTALIDASASTNLGLKGWRAMLRNNEIQLNLGLPVLGRIKAAGKK